MSQIPKLAVRIEFSPEEHEVYKKAKDKAMENKTHLRTLIVNFLNGYVYGSSDEADNDTSGVDDGSPV